MKCFLYRFLAGLILFLLTTMLHGGDTPNLTIDATAASLDSFPVFDPPPADITIQCVSDIPPPVALDWTDETDGSGSVLSVDNSNGTSCPEVITRSWSYTNTLGLNTTVIQTIIILDTQAAIFTTPVPPDVTVESPDDIPAMIDMLWTDNCDGAGSVFPTDSSESIGCIQVISRYWTFWDGCGNMTEAMQKITVLSPCPAPQFLEVPLDITLYCSDPIPEMPELAVSFGCGQLDTVPFNLTAIDDICTPGYYLQWAYTDSCGLTGTADWLVTFHDTTAPTLVSPASDITLNCTSGTFFEDLDAWVDSQGGAVFEDVCSGIFEFQGIEFTAELCAWPFSEVITFVAFDACGNTATATATLTITGTTSTEDVGIFHDWVKVMPNPAGKSVKVELAGHVSGSTTVRLFSSNGVLLESQSGRGSSYFLDIRRHPNGIYMLEISSADQISIQKLVKTE